MARREIDVVVYREGSQWVATALNVEVSSFGPTREEALASVREALELYFEGEESPVPPLAFFGLSREGRVR